MFQVVIERRNGKPEWCMNNTFCLSWVEMSSMVNWYKREQKEAKKKFCEDCPFVAS